jgi:hypothetical protein
MKSTRLGRTQITSEALIVLDMMIVLTLSQCHE